MYVEDCRLAKWSQEYHTRESFLCTREDKGSMQKIVQ